ncbi:MAG: hypothetical protein JO182_29695 [Acidobacteriaceae bacterium]|nr:hypothetical protein [Acidobacteriaceae bacterium]
MSSGNDEQNENGDRKKRISSVRISPDNAQVLAQLGHLADLAGTWEGEGFNLIARPNFHDKANLYLQLNQTREVLKVDPIGSPIPNRGFGQDDIELFGLTYLDKIQAVSADVGCRGALHIEPGIWVTQPTTSYPPETASLPGTAPGAQLIARMATIPHGNAVLAQGIAERYDGPPTLKAASEEYAFSRFPSFNSTPFATLPLAPPVISAAGSSEKNTATTGGVPPFNEYDLSVPDGPGNPRTPFGTPCPPLPADIDGVSMQDLINDPIKLLQRVITKQVANGHTFETTVLNVATQAKITFFKDPDQTIKAGGPTGPTVDVILPDFAGGIENMIFLEGGEPVGPKGPNADTALVYATFWIERVKHKHQPSFMQLQYAQMVILNFPIFTALPTVIPLGWPHITVATLLKTFN